MRTSNAGGVLLASLPLSSPRFPSLALGLLKQAVLQLGLACDVRYFALDYVDHVGEATFGCLANMDYYTALIGEWVFAEEAHRTNTSAQEDDFEALSFLADTFRAHCPETELVARLLAVLAARKDARRFIDHCVDSVDWGRYAVLGVTTSFQQNMASLAFASRVKARFPHILVVFGGANCQGEMGVELHRRFPFIDAVCLGEGDRTFPALVGRHLAGEDISGLPGFIVRGPDGMSCLPRQEVDQIENMDELPYPDFSDFYQQHAGTTVASKVSPALMFETARGCWWGAKHHCTFCGLNGRMMSYRSKSQRRAYDELVHLVERHGDEVVNADAILDPNYFVEFIPLLASQGPKVRMFWQMKANLRPEQLTLLFRAGVKRIQPGIEALDTELLTLMKKGCTMLQNVQLLKLAAENGLSVAWNLLYGFPGEDPGSYARTSALLPKLRHLQPPANTGRVFADRFSPYFQNPHSFGVTLEPVRAYQLIYPFEDASIRELAYHFHMRSETLQRSEDSVKAMREEQRLWCANWLDSALYCNQTGEALIVTDARWGWPRSVWTLEGADADVLNHCWRIRSWNGLRHHLGNRYQPAEIGDAIERLIDLGLLVCESGSFLSLPLRQPGWQRAPSWGEVVEDIGKPYFDQVGEHITLEVERTLQQAE